MKDEDFGEVGYTGGETFGIFVARPSSNMLRRGVFLVLLVLHPFFCRGSLLCLFAARLPLVLSRL